MNSSGMQEGPMVALVEAPYGTVWGLCSGATPVARLAVSAAGGLRSPDLLLLVAASRGLALALDWDFAFPLAAECPWSPWPRTSC